MKESRKEFIKKAHSAACSEWKTNIEAEFPKLFKEDDLVVGDYWYKNDCTLVLICDLGLNVKYIPIYESIESNRFGYSGLVCFKRKATDEEVEQALIKEAKKRGFKEGVNFKLIEGGVGMLNSTKITKDYEIVYEALRNRLVLERIGILYTILKDGVWATIVEETITKEEAKVITDKIEVLKNELLNKTIID